jgi:hypothetical protein
MGWRRTSLPQLGGKAQPAHGAATAPIRAHADGAAAPSGADGARESGGRRRASVGSAAAHGVRVGGKALPIGERLERPGEGEGDDEGDGVEHSLDSRVDSRGLASRGALASRGIDARGIDARGLDSVGLDALVSSALAHRQRRQRQAQQRCSCE